jgi:hypothetical protein
LPYRTVSYTGEQGFEPQQADPESAVLPLDDSPLEKIIVAFSDRMGKLMNSSILKLVTLNAIASARQQDSGRFYP